MKHKKRSINIKVDTNTSGDINVQQKRDFLIDALHIFVLSSFAFAQPLFGLLSRKAEFFVARHSKPVDIIVLILILCVVLPAILVAVEGLV